MVEKGETRRGPVVIANPRTLSNLNNGFTSRIVSLFIEVKMHHHKHLCSAFFAHAHKKTRPMSAADSSSFTPLFLTHPPQLVLSVRFEVYTEFYQYRLLKKTISFPVSEGASLTANM